MAPKSVLTIGLVLPPSPTTSAMRTAAAEAIAKANQSGYKAHLYAVDLADAAHIDRFRDFLRSNSHASRWDGVMVGWGIRGNPEHTELFEQLINVVIAQITPAPKFLFSLKPDGLLDAITRVMGPAV